MTTKGSMSDDVRVEASLLVDYLGRALPRIIDGRDAILEMRKSGSKHWRQMEWIGFWFEHFVEQHLVPAVGGRRGPSFGRTEFDLQRTSVWDLKAHPSSRKGRDILILNDAEAIETCTERCGGFGFIVVSGSVIYDDTGEFKAWHDHLKGGRSQYETERIKRGAQSRRRKTQFRPHEVQALFIPDQDTLQVGLDRGWLGYFQNGMRNSNGSPRRAKYQINLSQVPSSVVLAHRNL